MATLTITIDEAIKGRVLEAIASKGSYQATINGQPNPQSLESFARQFLMNYVQSVVVEYEAQQAAQEAEAAARAAASDEIVLS